MTTDLLKLESLDLSESSMTIVRRVEKINARLSHSFPAVKKDDYWILNGWWLLFQEAVSKFTENSYKNLVTRNRKLVIEINSETKIQVFPNEKKTWVWLLISWRWESCEHAVWIILWFEKWCPFNKINILHERIRFHSI